MLMKFFKKRVKEIDDAFTTIGDFIFLPDEAVKNEKELIKRRKPVKKSPPYKVEK
jgi:hypothetical protein